MGFWVRSSPWCRNKKDGKAEKMEIIGYNCKQCKI
jgi:hypothetical protein